ncbi:nucleotidyltransferase family protein [Leptospira alstonii]|uniref:CBS domain protein n=2 Tax=Leptospira alstonii TaxID=28452 RepID=M6CNJ5_9LEPT|nr:nucleotidyltransferase family protein [Leptospira alstonii]EMJ92106.1 CBS domain protein [Leptospira alstonii serovar Sichuan str. 79601]EQA80219.1 CBS domain protein [Leptospira alstonii serovar Pingchang str. 80-412]
MKNWKNVLINPNLSLQDAINVLDKGALRIVLIVDDSNKLLGTLTDGDIRRALLQNKKLSILVTEVMSSKPKVAYINWTKERMLLEMEKYELLHLPIVNQEGTVAGLETVHGLLEKPKLDNPVFLMAGGFGTRLYPLTNNCPKPMLKVGSKPILELILEGFVASGFHRFFISTHYMPEMIRNYFEDGKRWNVSIEYIHEEEPLGTGGALGLLPHSQINQPIFMMNGDLLTNLNYLSLLEFHEKEGGVATICVREFDYQVPYGVVQTEGHRVVGIIEKPVQRFNINAGIYLLNPDFVKTVDKGLKIDMPSLIEKELKSSKQVNIFPIHEYWLDIGRMEEFERAQGDWVKLFNE